MSSISIVAVVIPNRFWLWPRVCLMMNTCHFYLSGLCIQYAPSHFFLPLPFKRCHYFTPSYVLSLLKACSTNISQLSTFALLTVFLTILLVITMVIRKLLRWPLLPADANVCFHWGYDLMFCFGWCLPYFFLP